MSIIAYYRQLSCLGEHKIVCIYSWEQTAWNPVSFRFLSDNDRIVIRNLRNQDHVL